MISGPKEKTVEKLTLLSFFRYKTENERFWLFGRKQCRYVSRKTEDSPTIWKDGPAVAIRRAFLCKKLNSFGEQVYFFYVIN